MYTDMLNEAVRALKAGEEPDLESPFAPVCEVKLHTSALLPSDYCGDVHARLAIYKRLSHAKNEDELLSIQEELIDRFGKLPEPAVMLITTHRLRILAEPLGIIRLDISDEQAMLHFGPKANIDPLRMIELVQKQKHIRFSGADKLRMELAKMPDINQRMNAVRQLLKSLY